MQSCSKLCADGCSRSEEMQRYTEARRFSCSWRSASNACLHCQLFAGASSLPL